MLPVLFLTIFFFGGNALNIKGTQFVKASLSQHLEAISKYGFPKNDEKYLTFQVRACKEAIIALTDGKITYEVELGASDNTENVIRCDGSVLATDVAPKDIPPLDCKIRRPYWISWKKKSLKLGSGNRIGKGLILKYKLTKKLRVTSISVSDGGKKGCWKFGTKCGCVGGGYCATGTNKCRCPDGLTGKYCHKKCECENGGKCIGGTSNCRCPAIFTGKRCQTSVCNCQNGGTCRKGGSCKCAAGFVGKNCEMKCPCMNGGRCVGKEPVCKCPAQVYGGICEFTCPCQNEGRCLAAKPQNTSQCVDLGLGFKQCSDFDVTCKCQREWTGSTCETSACQCQNGGSCDGRRCVCPPGFIGKNCETKIKCCSVWGDPHVMTFDGARMDFQGDCRYNLMSICPCIVRPQGVPTFSVHMKNWRRGNKTKKVSWLKSLDVYIGGTKITLDKRQRVMINGVNASLPLNRIRQSSVTSNGRDVRLETSFGASVNFDGKTTATVCVPETWAGRLCGICGNFDDVRENDFTTKAGDRLAEVRSEHQRAPIVARSWRVMDNPGDTCDEAPVYQQQPETEEWKALANSREFCGLIREKEGAFAKCIEKLNPSKIAEYYRACVFDVMEMSPDRDQAKKMACSSLEAFAGECSELNSHDNKTWRHLTGCEYECPAGMVYTENMSPCVPTCAGPKAEEHCALPETEGCACTEGMLLSGGKCVKPSECGCTDSDGSYFQVREAFFSEDCKDKYVCQPGNETIASYIETLPGCDEGESCIAVNGVQQCALTPVDGDWGEWSDWGSCAKMSGYEGIVQMRTRKCDNPAPKNGGKCAGKSMEIQDCLPADYEEQTSIKFN